MTERSGESLISLAFILAVEEAGQGGSPCESSRLGGFVLRSFCYPTICLRPPLFSPKSHVDRLDRPGGQARRPVLRRSCVPRAMLLPPVS